jgi:hypothetical protein
MYSTGYDRRGYDVYAVDLSVIVVDHVRIFVFVVGGLMTVSREDQCFGCRSLVGKAPPSAASDISGGSHSLNATLPKLCTYCRCGTLLCEQSRRCAGFVK